MTNGAFLFQNAKPAASLSFMSTHLVRSFFIVTVVDGLLVTSVFLAIRFLEDMNKKETKLHPVVFTKSLVCIDNEITATLTISSEDSHFREEVLRRNVALLPKSQRLKWT